ncbi:hypothetical protein A5719_21210 [Mycolicibacterium peregrinum]|uniref:LysA protein n=1 Tax=Mycolicibacterium peregrinum TaxID=43304 RepID=A0A1A1Z2T8_MYCPR|nr:hypothetical protein A5779_10435 [Mycolicibacterium peregrinum]OBF37875.1 hypothetical protein A5719_21210 [Mycolicibacterium peregrinum]
MTLPIGLRSLGVVELSLPATALADSRVAKRARDHGLAVEVRTGADLITAIGVGIHPMFLIVYADRMTADELVFCTANLGVGRIVVTTTDQVDLLVSATVAHRRQRVLVGMTRVADDKVVDAVVAGRRLDLVGLACEIGSGEDAFVSYPAAMGDMLAEMAQIRRAHSIVLTRVAISGDGFAVDETPGGLSELAELIDQTLDDACATLRFPRPVAMVTAQPAGTRRQPCTADLHRT